jgi:uncharacterized protein YukE
MIFQCVFPNIDDAIKTVHECGTRIEKEIREEMTKLLLALVWEGRAADAFRDEFNNRFIQELNDLLEAIFGFRSSLEKGRTCVEDRDDEVFREGQTLEEIYDSIPINW